MTNRPSCRQACITAVWKRVVDESRPVDVAAVVGRGRGNGRAQAVLDGVQAATGHRGEKTEVGTRKAGV